ncbi:MULTISPECIES: glycosyltransferase family 39 protein [unclassified Mycobacterium]|uniref:glycosyltransferase family 39 protein n=1 Tax=unclassified Mycobacterium TaxID=2642494 RepID=UPI0029C8D7F1|nr:MULTISPECIES: glycosyltransferase family 39 protein [unclassified Mycobacterium]
MTETLERPETWDPSNEGPADPPQSTRAFRIPFRRAYLVLLLVATAALYLWNITINGMGNPFYAAAAQAGSRDWEALLFGSLDAQNFITVDKPPLSQWVMGLSGQLFGFSSASMLIPQALMAVAAVALTYAAVARISGQWTGLLAGLALAVTPVAVLMFRFNNPDAAMVLLMTAAAYCTVRALQHNGARWLALAGVAVGFAFLAKMLEGVMVMPALGAAYLVAAPVPMRRRLLHLLGAAAAFVAAAGWFVVLTLLWPASSRPYLAGSADNNFMNLVLGYNGFARVMGRNHPAFTPPPADVGTFAGTQLRTGPQMAFGGFGSQSSGSMRLVSGEFGYEIGWLLPTALVATVLVVIARGSAPRTDLVRAGAIMFGGWLAIDAAVLTLMHGMIHPYYSLSIAPPIAAMFALGVGQLWARRESAWYRGALAILLLATGAFGWWILHRNSDWLPALRWAVLAVAVAAAVVLASGWLARARPAAAAAALALALTAALAGPTAYAVATVGAAHEGGGPSVGPAQDGHFGGGMARGVDSPELADMLKQTDTKWSAAIERSSSAAALELSSGTSVMAIGGFSGTDPAPTLPQFKDDVANHRVAYYVSTGSGSHRPGWNSHAHADIAKWVAANFTATKVGSATVYDLSSRR